MKTISVEMGLTKDMLDFWTFPNNTSGVDYFPDQTIENTIEFYIKSSAYRDKVDIENIKVRQDSGKCILDMSGSDCDAYAAVIKKFLSTGLLGLAASREVNTRKAWNPVWRFMLPVGLAMMNHRAVELLHFPPEYVLERDRDYLLANTIIRWGECLILNGVDTSLVDQYQTTIDIAPIGASSNAGSAIEEALGNYSEYSSYITTLMLNWVTSEQGSKPLVAFGSPVRRWLHQTYIPDAPPLKVLDTGKIMVNGKNVPFAVANHPSFFYNVIGDKNTVPPKNYDELFAIMRQDLIAAKWQTEMSNFPGSDPVSVMQNCVKYYDTTDGARTICEQVYIQGFGMSNKDASAHCLASALLNVEQKRRIEDRLEKIAQELGANDGNETEALCQFAKRVMAIRKVSNT